MTGLPGRPRTVNAVILRVAFIRALRQKVALRLLESLAKICAVLAGVLLTVVTLMTCGSLIGRNLVGMGVVLKSAG